VRADGMEMDWMAGQRGEQSKPEPVGYAEVGVAPRRLENRKGHRLVLQGIH